MKTLYQKFEDMLKQAAEFKKSLDNFCDLLTDIRDDDNHPELFDSFDNAVEDLVDGIDLMTDVEKQITSAQANIPSDVVVYVREGGDK